MTKLSAFSKASARLRFSLLILFFLLFWLVTAFLLHPEHPIQNPSSYLIPGGPRSNLLLMQFANFFKRFVAMDTLARVCVLALGYILARMYAVHFLSHLYYLDQLDACHRFLSRLIFGMHLRVSLNRRDGDLLAAFPEIKKLGGPADIIFPGVHPKFGIYEDDRQIDELSSDDLQRNLPSYQTLKLIKEECEGSFTMDCACRTLDGIRIGLTDIQVKYQASRDRSSSFSHEEFVSYIVRSEINKFIRNQSLLLLMESKPSPSASQTWTCSPSMRSQIRTLRPHVSLLPTVPPFEYRVTLIPEIEYHDHIYSLDFCGKIVMEINQRLKELQKDSGYLIEIIGMGDWKFLSDSAKKQMDKIWSYISSPVALDRPDQVEQKKRSCEQNTYKEHLSQLKQILSNTHSRQRSMTVNLFYHEFLQRRLEDYRLEGLPIPGEILSLLEVLENAIEPNLSDIEGDL